MGYCFALLLAFSIPLGSADVPTVTIAPGVNMPMMAFGTMHSSLVGCAVTGAVEMYVKTGVRHIDTSKMYGTQKLVGAGIRAAGVPRNELFLTAKIEGPIGYNATLEQVAKYDMPDLGVDYLDLLLIHWPCSTKPYFGACPDDKEARLDTWRALEHLKATGKVRAIGVSDYMLSHLNELYDGGYQPSVNQVLWNVGFHHDDLLQAAKAKGTHLEAWASLGSPVAQYTEEYTHAPSIRLNDPVLVSMAKKYGVSTPQVSFNWMHQKGVTPVTGSCNADHVKGDLNSFQFALSAEDVATLDHLAELRKSMPSQMSTLATPENSPVMLAIGCVAFLLAACLFSSRARDGYKPARDGYIMLD